MVKHLSRCLRMFGWRGLQCAAQAKWNDACDLFQTQRSDVRHPFWLRMWSSDVSTYKQIFVKEEYKFPLSQQPDVIVDAGANIGLATIYFANKFPQAKIIAIEPQLSNYKLLRENVAPYPNVIPVQAALWHEDGSVNIVDPGRGHWGFMAEAAERDSQSESESESKTEFGEFCHAVEAISVDKLLSDFELEKIDIFKIDIEGAEKEVFTQTSSWIEKVRVLIVELHERIKPGCHRNFYNAVRGFASEWHRGENVFLSR